MEDNTKSIDCNEIVEENGCACDNVTECADVDAECADVDTECAGVDEELAVFDDLSEPILIEHKRKPIGGIIAGIFNILFSLPAFVAYVFTAIFMFSGVEMAFQTLEGWEGLGLAIILVYGLAFAAVAAALSIPSLIYFIVARFNRSKFFKISTIIISSLLTVLFVLVIFEYGFIWADAKFGWF